jgi:hypothetical protein
MRRPVNLTVRARRNFLLNEGVDRATSNGSEGAAACATDTALILDELGQATVVTSPLETNRTRHVRGSRIAKAEDRGRKTRAGQLVRMLDIPTARACGVFDNAGPDGDAVP